MFQRILFCCCLFASALMAQVPQFDYNSSCDPGFFDPDPFFSGEILFDGAPAEIGIDSFAIFDHNDEVIIARPIQQVIDPMTNTSFSGFLVQLNEENGDGCAGYDLVNPIKLVFYDASFAGCGFHEAPNGTFTITINGNNVVEGPDGDGGMIDAYNFSSTSCVTALPVQFSSFRARPVDGGVVLNWTTGEEVNNSHFEIETSTDGRQWEYLGAVNGAGNTARETSYEFVDAQPAPGSNLYRIKQVDFDGAFTYSSIATVVVDRAADKKAVLYPNPITDGQTTLTLQGDWSETTSAKLTDFSGRVLADFQNVSVGSSSLDLPGLPSGIYQLVVSDQDQREIIRLVIR